MATYNAGQALLLACIRDETGNLAHLDDLCRLTVQNAAAEQVGHIFVLLSTTSDVRHRWSVPDKHTFAAVQRVISSTYLSIAKHAKHHRVDLESTVIFEDWCGYNLPQETVPWVFLAAAEADRELLGKFARQHESALMSSLRELVLDIPVSAQLQSLPAAQSARKFDTVAVGGTFDHLHAGHKILLTMTLWLAHRQVICGMTDDALLVNKKHKEVMQDLPERTKYVQIFCNYVKRGIDYQMVPINDVAGPTGSVAAIQALVASRETEAGSAQIRQIRSERGLPPLDILFIDVIGPDGVVDDAQMTDLKLSSTAIRQQLMSKI